MKLQADLTINGKLRSKGSQAPWYAIYPFFLFHMLLFGGSGFAMAYAEERPPLAFLYAHGGIAILVYTVFYVSMFGRDEVKWMFINAALGVLGIYGQMGWLLSLFGKRIGDYPLAVHVIPGLYFVLYTFLLRHAVLHLAGARDDEAKKRKVEYSYVGVSVLLSVFLYYLDHRAGHPSPGS
jgi:hypothetical protein